jgi:hypothetical protein
VQLGLRAAGLCGVVARVRAVVRRDGGPGRWCRWVGAEAPKALSAECIVTLCRVGDEVISILVVGVVWRSWRVVFFTSVGASRVCSSHSTHGVFSPALVGGRLVLVGWGCVGFAPVVSILAQFSIN